MTKDEAGRTPEIGDILDVVNAIWRRRLVILACVIIAAGLGTAIAFLLPPVYRSEAVVQIRDESTGSGALRSLASQLGPLSALAGLGLDSNGDQRAVALALVKSRTIVEKYIEENGLMPILFPRQWDSERGSWRSGLSSPPSTQDAYRKFTSKIFSVTEDRRTGLVSVAVEWKDPELAREWVLEIIEKTNAALKSRTIAESNANLHYLQEQSRTVSLVQLQSALAALMEVEHKKLMLANNAEDYVLRIIDPPQVAQKKSRPKRALIIAFSAAAGIALGVLFSLLQIMLEARRRPEGAPIQTGQSVQK